MLDSTPLSTHPWPDDKKLFGELTDKQRKILKAALTVFIEKGYSAATTREIALAAGVSEGAIFRHFQTKKDILLATLIPLMQNFLGPGVADTLHDLMLQNDKLPLEDVLVLIIQDRLHQIATFWPLLQVVFIEANFHPELKETLVHTVITRVQETFLTFLQQRQNKGELRPDVDIWAMMRNLVGAAAFFLLSRSLFPEREQGKDERQELKVIIDLFLRGARTQS